MLKDLTLALVDVETTGGSAGFDRIIEIGIKRIERGRVVKTYTSLVNPECRIPPFIQQLTGITEDDVAEAPTFARIQQEIRALLEGCIFVAHNARFDYGFLKNEFQRVEHAFTAKCLCTVRLSRLLYPGETRHDLSSLIERFGFTCEHRHRALDDAAVLWDFLKVASKQAGAARFDEAVQALLKTPTLPPGLAAETLDALPDGPGVYIFYDAGNMPLYVGKSLNIRDRVLSHFSGDHASGREMKMCQQTARIEARSTYGELGALLLESHLIKQLMPLYNRLARTRRTLTAIRRGVTQRGFHTVEIVELPRITEDEQESVITICRSKKQAKDLLYELAKEHRLCPKLLGVEHARGPCFYSQIGYCAGACAGRERAAVHNARLAAALVERQIKRWPYPGPVLIEERGADHARGHLFIVDQWRLVHSLAYADDGRSVFLNAQESFDYDSYKILARYVLHDGRRVKPLQSADLASLLDQPQ